MVWQNIPLIFATKRVELIIFLYFYLSTVRPEKIFSEFSLTNRFYFAMGLFSSVMHAFWLILTYDLLEDRRTDDVIIKTFF